VSVQTNSEISKLKTLLTYIYPSLRNQIESSLAYCHGERELVALSNLIKAFTIAGVPEGVIHCLHHVVRQCEYLSKLDPTSLRKAAEIEIPRLGMIPDQLENLNRLSSGHDQYILKVLGTYASTLLTYALHPLPSIPMPQGEQLDTRYLGAVLESAITSTRLLLPAFVEQSGIYILIARLYHQDIHFAVEYIQKTPPSSDHFERSLKLVQPVADRYGITPQSPTLLEDPRRSDHHGYVSDPAVLQYFYSQLLHLR
jgi:hypothetical protein